MAVPMVIGVGAELLAERHGYGVLVFGASHLEDMGELLLLRLKSRLELTQRSQGVLNREVDGQLDCGGVGIVGGLGTVDVVVRVQELVFPLVVPQHLQRPVGDHLVGVHVGGGPGPTLDHVDDEMLMELTGQDFVAGRADRHHLFLGQDPQLAVGLGGAFLDKGQSIDEVFEVAQRQPGDIKILPGPQGLHAKISGERYVPFAKGVVLSPDSRQRDFWPGLASDLVGRVAQPFGLALRDPGNDAVEDVGFAFFDLLPDRQRNLQYGDSVAGKGAG